MDIDEFFTRHLRDRRQATGTSQAALAQALTERGVPHMSQASVQAIEVGKRRVTLGEATTIAHILGFVIPGIRADDENAAIRRRHERIKAIIDGQDD